MRPLLVPGETCASLIDVDRSGVLVDGKDFYRAFYDACCKAERTILMAGWQFSCSVELVRGEDAACCKYPTTLIELLSTLCEERPDLHVYMLPWDSSPVFAFEREPLQRLKLRFQGHDRIHWKMDNMHPAGASHHQKLFIIDRAVAILGGMDVCRARWDDRQHEAVKKTRENPKPYHDVNAFVTGEAVDTLRNWFADRWAIATGKPLELPDQPRKTIEIRSSFDIHAPRVALARTWPKMEKSHIPEVRELLRLHQRAIGQAKKSIYIENQYFSSYEIATALECRLRQGGPPLEIVMVLPQKSAGLKERVSIGVYQQRILENLTKLAKETGHRLGVYYQAAVGSRGKKEIPVFIHAKVLAVDDRFLLISSANLSNRSMGFDTELGIAWESPNANDSIRAARIELLAEHCGMERDEAEARFAHPHHLVAKLDELARSRSHLLRIHKRNRDEKPGWLMRRILPKRTPLDPANPQQFREGLPEPVAWLDRLIREPAVVLFGDRLPWLRKKNA